MKTRQIILSLILFAAWMPFQLKAQNFSISVSRTYDLSDHLDLEAVATVFAQSKNIEDFEYQLNDYRNQVSNLDLNNDGYVDYLRVIKMNDRNEHIILIQAVLNRNYFQDVATIIVGRDNFNREYVQIIGEPSLFGADYIVEPIFAARPRVVRWLWNYPTTVYVSKYYWGYYPRIYRVRTILPIHNYFNHVKAFVNVSHHYYYTTQLRFPVYVQAAKHYSRNDYWRNNPGKRFDQRNRDYKNKGSFQQHQEKKKPEVKDRNSGNSETERRQLNQGGTTTRPQPRVTPSDNRATTSQGDRPTVAPRQTESRTQPTARPIVQPNRPATTTRQPTTVTRPTTTITAKPAVSTPSSSVTTTPKSSSSSSTNSTSSSSSSSSERQSTTTSRPSGNRR